MKQHKKIKLTSNDVKYTLVSIEKVEESVIKKMYKKPKIRNIAPN